MSTIIPYRDIEEMAKSVVASRLFGMKSQSEAIALMLVAQAEGLHPMVAARDYDIIQGRPALKSRAMLARFQQSGGKIDWKKRSDKECEAVFSHPQSPTPVTIRWDWERATKAGLTGKDNWRKYPAQMLAARVISEGVNACYPAACNGMYTPEEVADFDDRREVVKEATVIEKPVETWRDTPVDVKAMGAGFDRVPPPAEPAAAELDEKINGKREEPPAEAREIIVKFQGKGKPPVKKFPQEMTDEELETAIETARWRWKQAHDKADKYSEKNMAEAAADGKALQAEAERRKPAGAEAATGVVPAAQAEVPETAPAEIIEADVLTANHAVFVRRKGKVTVKRKVSEMEPADWQDAYDAAQAVLADPNEKPATKSYALGVVNLLEANPVK